MNNFKILTINPGSTSTKIGVFEDRNPIFVKTLRHDIDKLNLFPEIIDQYDYRKEIILDELDKADIPPSGIDVIMARGGLIKPVPSGVYEVNERMKADLRSGISGKHASNLAGLIAVEIAALCPARVKAYIADPVVVDELQDVARIAGHPEFERVSIFHALNQKAMARKYAESIGKDYEDINLIVTHLGGGISVGAHCKGRVIDVNNALNGEGPFTPERSGTLPAAQLVKISFGGKYSENEILKMITGEGGYVAYFGTNDAYTVEKRAEAGDSKCKLIQDAMSYRIGKAIGESAAVLKGKVDGIVITGGMAHNKYLCDYVHDMVSFIAPVAIYPGEDESAALAENGLLLLNGKIEAEEYK